MGLDYIIQFFQMTTWNNYFFSSAFSILIIQTQFIHILFYFFIFYIYVILLYFVL